MSQYINFFIKTKHNDVVPLGEYSRSSEIYQAAKEYAPYERSTFLTEEILNCILSGINEKINDYNNMLAANESRKADILAANNSLEEKMEELSYIYNGEDEIKEELRYNKHAKSFFSFLQGIIDEAEGTKFYSDPNRHIDHTKYIRFGIECDPYEDEGDKI